MVNVDPWYMFSDIGFNLIVCHVGLLSCCHDVMLYGSFVSCLGWKVRFVWYGMLWVLLILGICLATFVSMSRLKIQVKMAMSFF